MALNGFRSRISAFLLGKSKEDKPVIMTEFGPVNEAARLQAARNMRASDEVKYRVEQALAKEMGSAQRGIQEARKRYREAYPDLDGTY